jgi:hypothetical protein
MKKKKRTKKEYSKRMTTLILIVALVDIQLTYILAFLGKEIAETLAITLVTEVVAVFGTYSIKAYLGKRNEEKTRLEESQQNFEQFNSGMTEVEYDRLHEDS